MRIFVTRCLPENSCQLLKNEGITVIMRETDDAVQKSELLEKIVGCDALICMLTDKIDKPVLDAAGPNLKVVATVSVGYDHIDLAECKKRNIVVSNTPEVSTDAVSELTVALLLSVSRRILECSNVIKRGEWDSWGLMWMCGTELHSSIVGFFGLGRIGMAVATRLQSFGVAKFYYTDIEEKPFAAKIGAERVDFQTLLRQSDFVIINCALTPETRGVFNSKAFAVMKSTAIIVNVARGGVIHQENLYEALKAGIIRGAGLDVTNPEPMSKDDRLLTVDNCVVTPHIGSNTIKTRTEMADLAVKNVLAVLAGKPLLTPV